LKSLLKKYDPTTRNPKKVIRKYSSTGAAGMWATSSWVWKTLLAPHEFEVPN
jgi:hypothetical protein